MKPVGSTEGRAALIDERHDALAVDTAHLGLQPLGVRGASHGDLDHLALDDMPLCAHSMLLPCR